MKESKAILLSSLKLILNEGVGPRQIPKDD
jgi:hypothetical protein